MVRKKSKEYLGHDADCARAAIRGRRGGNGAWEPANRRPNYHVHREPGLAPDDSQHVQDCRRANQHRLSYRRAVSSNARAFDLWRSQRRDGHPFDGLGNALRQLDPGDYGFRLDFSGRDIGNTRTISAHLRRLSQLARSDENPSTV